MFNLRESTGKALFKVHCAIHNLVHGRPHRIDEEYDDDRARTVRTIKPAEDGVQVQSSRKRFMRWLLLCPFLLGTRISAYLANRHHPVAGWLALVAIIAFSGFFVAGLAGDLLIYLTMPLLGFSLPIHYLCHTAGFVIDAFVIGAIFSEARHQ
jgi:hypothetical protein